jgi:hypothetical protein
MMAQIINLAEYRKAKASAGSPEDRERLLRRAQSSDGIVAVLSCRGRLRTPEGTGLIAVGNASANAVPISRLEI